MAPERRPDDDGRDRGLLVLAILALLAVLAVLVIAVLVSAGASREEGVTEIAVALLSRG